MKETKTIDPALAAIADPEKEMEIFPGMTVEEIRSLYFDKNA